MIIHIQDAWTAPDTNRIMLTDWTSDATRNITIQTEGVARHNGDISCVGTCYVLDVITESDALRNTPAQDYFTLDGFLITDVNSGSGGGLTLQGQNITIKNMIIYDLYTAGSSVSGISVGTPNTSFVVENTIFQGEMASAIVGWSNAPVINYDFTMKNCIVDITNPTPTAVDIRGNNDGSSDLSGSKVTIINTMLLGSYENDLAIFERTAMVGYPDYSGSTNVITSGATAQTVLGLDNTNSAINVSLVDAATAPVSYDGNKYVIVQETLAGSQNYHLVDNPHNLALGGGTDLTATVPNDIDGDLISATQYQLGPDYLADTTGPVVQEVYITETDGTTTKPDGAYGNAATMSFIVEFSQTITVTGAPQLTHNASATPINCMADPTRWNALKCDYTVGATDASLDLDFASTTALALNGGTITDKAGNAATLTLPTPNAIYSASDNQAIQITAGTSIVDVYVRPTVGDCGATPACYTTIADVPGNIIADTALSSKDLVAQNLNIIVHIQGDWSGVGADTAEGVYLNGYTTDATHNITIIAEGTARHDGTVTCTTCYRIDPDASGSVFSIGISGSRSDTSYTTIDGFLITGMDDSYANHAIFNRAGQIYINNMIFYDLNPLSNQYNAAVGTSSYTGVININVSNSMILGRSANAITTWSNGSHTRNFYIDNTIIDLQMNNATCFEFRSDNPGIDFSNVNVQIRNSILSCDETGGQSIGYNNAPSGYGTFTGSTNVITSDDDNITVMGLDGSNSRGNVSVIDIAAAPGSYDGNDYVIVQETALGLQDYHLVDNAFNLALGAGTDLSATIPNDIDGDLISATQYQIGPDYLADTTSPVVTEIFITDQLNSLALKADGDYDFGATMSVVIEFSEVINVGATPQLAINSTSTLLNCSADTNRWNAIKCDYSVGVTDSTGGLDIADTTSLTGGSITDRAGNPAVLTLPIPGTAYAASGDQDINIANGTYFSYIRPDCTAVPAPAPCYESLSAWDIADGGMASRDLVSQGLIHHARIQGDWTARGADTAGAVILSGWTTDATHYIRLQAEGNARQNGIASTGAGYRLQPTTSAAALQVGVSGTGNVADTAYTQLDGFEIIMSDLTGISSEGILVYANEMIISNMIIHDSNTPATPLGQQDGIQIKNTNANLTVFNSLIYNINRSAIGLNNGAGNLTLNIDNVTAYNVCLGSDSGGGFDYPAFGPMSTFEDEGTTSTNIVINVHNTIGDCRNTGHVGGVAPDFKPLSGTNSYGTSSNNISLTDETAPGVDSFFNVTATDVAPIAYTGSKQIVFTDLTPGSEDFTLIDNAWNIGFSGVDRAPAFDPDEDIEEDTIVSWYHIGSDWTASTTSPVVNEVYITEPDGVTLKPDATYGPGENFSFVIEFSRKIIVTGTPQLTIDDTVNTVLDCGAHSTRGNALKCDYTVASGTTTDLDYLNTSALIFNGGTIKDRAGNDALLALPTPNAIYSASDNQEIVIIGVLAEVLITSAPAINNANQSSYPISGTCSDNGTSNVDLNIGGITTSVDCSAGTFSATMNLSGLTESPITCPANFVLVERNTKYTTEKFCIARYESRNNVGSISLDPSHSVWNGINRSDAETQCQSMGGTFDLLSNSQWQTVAINAELNPANWYDGTIGGDGNVFVIGHSDNVPASIETISDIMDPYSNTGNSSSDGATTGWAQRRTHLLDSGQEVWDLGGNVLEWVKDDFTSTALNEDAISITATGTFVANAGFADVNDSKDIANQFGPSTDYSSWTLGGTNNAGYLGRIYGGSQAGIIRGGAYFTTNNGIFTAGVDGAPTNNNGLRGFRCMSQISGGHLAQADHLTAVTDSVTISKDTVTPAAPTLTGPSPGSTYTTFDHTFTGTCSSGNIITISGDVIGSPVKRECIGGNYSIEVSFTSGDGVKDVNIDEADLAGNSSSIDESFDIFATPASIAIISAPTINIANQSSYTVTGTCSPNLSGVIFITTGGVTSPAGNCIAGNFSVSYDVSGASDGASVSVVAEYGRAPSATDSTTVLKDTIAPTDLTVAAGITTATRVVTQSGNCEVGATVSITGDVETDIGPFTQVCPGGGTYSLDFALSRGAGAKTVSIIETDPAGNPTAVPETENYTFNRRPIITPKIAATTLGTCFIRDDKQLLCSGNALSGVRGDGSPFTGGTTYVYSAKPINMSTHTESNNFIAVEGNGWSTSEANVCAIHVNGKGFCWGSNTNGQLGNNSTVKSSTPQEIDMSGNTPSTNLWSQIAVSASDNFVCGIHQTTSELFCWGKNSAGGLGNGLVGGPDVLKPAKVDMSGTSYSNSFVHVSIGDGQACGVHTNGRLFCWGEGSAGRLGINDATGTDYATPQEVDMSANGLYDNDFIKTSGGDDHMCALHSSGKIYCWGDDETGGGFPSGSFSALANADGTDTDYPTPQEIDTSGIAENNEFQDVKGDIAQSCALHDNGKLFCWGANNFGGIPTDGAVYGSDGVQSLTEVQMSHLSKANNFTDFTTTSFNTCARHADGTYYCSGFYGYAGLPIGTGGANTTVFTEIMGMFTPDKATTADIAAWYDSSDTSTLFQNAGCSTPVSGNGQDVACWLDKSGNSNTATQSTGSDVPVYNSTRKAIEFDGTNDWLSIGSDVGFPYGTTSRSVFTQATVTDTTPSYQFIFAYGNGGTTDQAVGIGMQDTRCLLSGWGSNFINSAGGCVSLSQSYNMSATFDGSNQDLWRNGTLVESESFAWNTIPSLARIGTQVTAAAEYWNGDITEILLFDDELSAAEREKVEGYMACKWGSQGSLPGGHPYATNCP